MKFQSERTLQDATCKLKQELDEALSRTRALPGQPCQGCLFRDSRIAARQHRNEELTANLADSTAEGGKA